MKIYERFRSIGEVQRWAVPDGVDSAYFECWGAAGGMPSQLAFEGKKRQVKGGTGPRNIYFYNSPFRIGQLGDSYANNAGYVAGRRDVTEDQVYLIYVGSNGKPGHSTIKLNDNGTSYTVGLRGGEGGWPNGGDGGKGAHIHQNLHDRKNNHVTYKRDTIPPVAKVGQRWWDTSGNQAVYECAERYNNNKSFNVTQKARSSGTATLTIGTHILVVGDHIDITGVDATFNATDKVVTAKTSTTVSYNNAGSNVTTTSASGSVAGPKGVGPSTSNRNWTKVTKEHPHAVGPSGGGGGGATDIRLGGNDLSDRIMVAGGGGGAGGHWNRTGKAKWELRATPDKPNPPFGNDDKGTGATGPDSTWAAKTSYFVGGWGRGGVGGATGPSPQRKITGDGGFATTGGAGGPATDRHEDSTSPDQANGSGGGGGGPLAGGSRGTGGTGGSAGSSGTGGSGADATGAPDDFCAGGGGGGGGYWGGGGGGQGFKVAGDNSGVRTRGGGGGGGSNYVHQVFQDVRLVGAARPPSHDPQHEHTGANGYGGFVRISYNKPPDVVWKDAPTAVDSSLSSFDASFTYKPAIDGGAKIDHYVVGTAASLSATFPTTQQTVMVDDHSQTEFTRAFTPPSSGGDVAIFVKVVDTDGDESGWLKQKVHGLSASEINHATITSPASGGTFVETATVVWTLGTQTPLIGYRLGISGNKLTDAAVALGTETPWRRGGSRVNLALDPGFAGSTARWFSDVNSALVRNDTSFPGVSTKNGKISWALTSDWDAENHTSTWDNLIPGFTYRLHLKLASGLALDPRPVEIQVWDADGFLTSTEVDLSGQLTAGAYVTVDLEFTPHTQGVYFALRPSASEKESEQFTNDFDDGTVQSWVAGASVTQTADNTLAADANSGEYSLKLIGNALDAGSTKDITSLLLGGAGWYVVELYSYTPAAAVSDAKVTINGLGVAATRTGSTSVRDAWAPIRTSFLWDGIGAVVLNLRCDTATAKNYDDITVWTQAGVAESTEAYGNTDSQQVHYLADLLVEQVFEEDGTGAGYPAYFDGAHLNGLTGSVSWAGTANASESYLTGTDILTGDLTWEDFTPLSGGFLYLDTRTQGAAKNGYAGSRATQPVEVNPSVPTMPTVTVTNDQAGGIVSFDIDAGDGAASNKTVSFDILRDGVRIATGLTPDATTRHASYLDFPPTGVAVTYLVRAWDDLGGYRTQSTGTVTVLP